MPDAAGDRRSELTAREFQASEGVADWRTLSVGASAWFGAGSHAAGAALVRRVVEAAEASGLPQPHVELRSTGVRVRIAPDEGSFTDADVALARAISERLSARQLSAFLNEYLSAMTEVIMARGGTVDKFIGDAIMAFWGAPLADAGHAPHAVAAALAMRRLLAELQPRWAARGLPPIDIGIGLNSGVVSVGNMGSSTRFSYTVMGDAVNLASRLEGLTRVYDTGMLISDATRRAIGDAFHCRPIDVVCVKGKLEPAALFEPLCEGPPDAAMAAETGRFTEALEAYRRRDFDACRGLIEALQRDHPQCRLYALYRERLELFRQQPPPPEWDGVFTFTTKGHDE